MSRPVPPPRPTWHGVWEKEKRTLLLSEFTQWLNWSCSCSNTMFEDTLGNFLRNIARQLWEMLPSTGNQVRHRAHNWSKISTFVTHSQWGSAQATLLKKFPRVSSAYHSLNNKETQSDLTINISSLSRSPFKGTLSRWFWRYGERFAWYVLKHVWNQARCNGTSERVTSRTGSYKACPNEAVTSLLCLHNRSVWNCPCLIWCCLSVLNYSEMASKLLVCAFIPARDI